MLGGVVLFVHIGSWNSGILGVFIVLFGLLTFFLEFEIPEFIVYNMGFMFSMLGRGVCNMGLLCLSWKWYNIVIGSVIMGVGLMYVGLHFKGAKPSHSMTAEPTGAVRYGNPPEQGFDQPSMSQSYQNPEPYDPARP
ncbi:Late Golgi vesicles protein [Dissophora ornata]|nr:Late Golgi vesicles protein [Dissophora ornata]